MREIRPYGSVRGALSNGCPYRDPKNWMGPAGVIPLLSDTFGYSSVKSCRIVNAITVGQNVRFGYDLTTLLL